MGDLMGLNLIKVAVFFAILIGVLIVNNVFHVPVQHTKLAAALELSLLGGFLTAWGATCL